MKDELTVLRWCVGPASLLGILLVMPWHVSPANPTIAPGHGVTVVADTVGTHCSGQPRGKFILCSQPILFTDRSGNDRRARVTVTADELKRHPGILTVMYDARNPAIVRPIPNPSNWWFFLAMFIRGGIGMFLGTAVGFGIAESFRRRRNPRRQWDIR